LVLPPAMLSESTAQKRAVNSSFSNQAVATSNSYEGEESIGEGTDVSAFTVKDWAIVLQLGMSEEFLAANPATLVGFVSADESDPENVFYVARFDIACCAVDATPYGVAVYSPGWAERLTVGDWVQVDGILVPNPSESSAEQFAIDPDGVSSIPVPADPYLY
jgi:putative membrane protein